MSQENENFPKAPRSAKETLDFVWPYIWPKGRMDLKSVSYTHLDVYKRQPLSSSLIIFPFGSVISSIGSNAFDFKSISINCPFESFTKYASLNRKPISFASSKDNLPLIFAGKLMVLGGGSI